MAEAAMKLAAAGEMDHQRIANPLRKSGRDFTELEQRQAMILSRLAVLFGSLDDSVKCELIRRQRDQSREFVVLEAPVAIAAAGELDHQRIGNPMRKYGTDWTGLEQRQATILSRIACLLGSLDDSLNCELVRRQQESSCENAGRDGVPASFACRSSSAAAFPNKSCGDDEQGQTHSRELGEKVFLNRNGMTRDCTGGGGQRQCGDGIFEQGITVETRLSQTLREAGADFVFKRVPSDYYERSFEERRDLLGAASVDHLCKSIVMVNTQAHESVIDCSDRNNSKYYVIVVQYTARLNAEKVKQFVYSLNNGKIPKKRFNLRLAPEEESNRLTGFEHNAVTPFGMRTNIPVILSDAIVKLNPTFFWLGGGEVDLKLGVRTDDFVKMINPFVVDCTY